MPVHSWVSSFHLDEFANLPFVPVGLGVVTGAESTLVDLDEGDIIENFNVGSGT